MFFSKKNKKERCVNCNSSLNSNFNFCPYCGFSLNDERKDKRELGFFGRDDLPKAGNPELEESQLGITDKIFNSLMNQAIKTINKQIREMNIQDIQENARIEHLPQGIKISIGIPGTSNQIKPRKEKVKKQLTEEQENKLSILPRAEAKTKIRRLTDKVIYEISATGIKSPDDIFISKLENGYEVKAIGEKRVYVNSIQINLPLSGFYLADNKLLVEFKS